LVASNGDAELWVRLCGVDNPPPIRAIKFRESSTAEKSQSRSLRPPNFSVASAYWPDLDGRPQIPENLRVGDHRGQIQEGLQPGNLLPWCVLEPTTEAERTALLEEWHARPGRANQEPPWCPESLFVGAGPVFATFRVLEVAPLNVPDERRDTWATRGAMNVGASVFTYLNALSKGLLKPKPAFDACDLGRAR
jgi:hypothetical protein